MCAYFEWLPCTSYCLYLAYGKAAAAATVAAADQAIFFLELRF